MTHLKFDIRISEAEKSHQKAEAQGYVECWTIINVDRTNMSILKNETPSTNRFYRLSQIISGAGDEFKDFESGVRSLTGIPDNAPVSKRKKKKI